MCNPILDIPILFLNVMDFYIVCLFTESGAKSFRMKTTTNDEGLVRSQGIADRLSAHELLTFLVAPSSVGLQVGVVGVAAWYVPGLSLLGRHLYVGIPPMFTRTHSLSDGLFTVPGFFSRKLDSAFSDEVIHKLGKRFFLCSFEVLGGTIAAPISELSRLNLMIYSQYQNVHSCYPQANSEVYWV